MTLQPLDRAAVERRLWNELQRHQTGMLGLVGEGARCFQPMSAFAEPDNDELWFFSRSDTNLVRRVGEARAAVFVFQTREVHACIGGELAIRHDEARMEKYWNAVIAAWHPEGRGDPRLTMLRLRAADAEVWVTEAGPMRFAWEIAVANARRQAPDLSDHTHLRFH
ncbi:pyridoxamine 5'-phosphate oxidase family protein [Phenylobacterium sp.]|uniref:pyridoxamine 5'-phosphate oxidase family protein n=1 Tax=Phenylobacterium sp. TaxID=1871053 RepID=UPI0035B3D28B